MKYNININQNVLAYTNLDLLDCAILDWLIAFCNSTHEAVMKYRDENGYTWVSYSILLKDMPLLRIKSKGALSKRFKNIKEEGFIDTYIKNGDRLFVKPTSKIDTLIFSTVHKNERSGDNRSPKETLPFTKMNATVHQNEPTIVLDNNTSTTPKDEGVDDVTIEPVAEFQYNPLFIEFWAIYPKKVGKGNAHTAWLKIKPKITRPVLEKITASVQAYMKTPQWKKDNGQFIPHPATFINQRRWDDEVSDTQSVVRDPKYNNLKVHTA